MKWFGNYLTVLSSENFEAENSEAENSEAERLEIVKFDIVRLGTERLLATDNFVTENLVVVCFETGNPETEFPDLGSKNSRRAQPHLDYY